MIAALLILMLAFDAAPAAPEAAEHMPQMAAQGSTVALTFGAGKKIYFRASHDAGATFSPAVTVAQSEIIPLSRHRGPRIVISGQTIVISAVAGKSLSQEAHAHGLPSDGDLLVWRSVDGGRNWSKGIVVNDIPGAATEGLHSIAADQKGNLFAAWLDKRSGKGTTLFGARSTDGGFSWSKNVLIYDSPEGSICECCHPSVAIGANGQILIMWRNWLKGSRDMYLTRSKDGQAFSSPEKLGAGNWELNACPMDGGGLTVSDGRIVTAWRRDHSIFVATPGQKEVLVGEGVDVAIAAGQGGEYLVWSTPTGIKALLPGGRQAIAVAPKGSFPTVVAVPNGRALAAWENDGKIQIAPIPQK